MNGSAFMPLYLNSNMISNLFVVLVHLFPDINVNVKSITTRNQDTVSFDVPISELSHGICGQYVQGDIHIQLLTETKLERIAIEISQLIKVTDMLNRKNLLKRINNGYDINSLKEQDFIEVSCTLRNNSQIEYMEELVDLVELKLAFDPNDKKKEYNKKEDTNKKDIDKEDTKKENDKEHDEKENKEEDRGKEKDLENDEYYPITKEALQLLKDKLNEWKNERCLKLISDPIGNTDTRIVVPIEGKHMVDNIAHLTSSPVTIIGKVVKIGTGGDDKKMNLKSETCFDYLYQEYFDKIKEICSSKTFFNSKNICRYCGNDFDMKDTKLIQILPIAMHL